MPTIRTKIIHIRNVKKAEQIILLFKLATPLGARILKETRRNRNVAVIIPILVKNSTYNIDSVPKRVINEIFISGYASACFTLSASITIDTPKMNIIKRESWGKSFAPIPAPILNSSKWK